MDKLNAYINEVMNFAELKKSEELTNLMKKYVDMLFSWHKMHNIISTRDPIYFIKRDMCDCLNICKYLPDGKLFSFILSNRTSITHELVHQSKF